jgi:hypothetical protein
MAHVELTGSDWGGTVERLGGAAVLEPEARATGAFLRPREVKCGVDLLRLVFAYCLGLMGLRLTAAWAEGIGLASLSNVALLGRLRNAVPWLESIVARLLARPEAQSRTVPVGAAHATGQARSMARLIRLVDATTVRKAGKSARENGRLWRIHAVYDLPSEQFSSFELSDEKGAERIDRVAVAPGEIRIADRIHCRADELAEVIADGAEVIVRAGWNSARWLEEDGRTCDLIGLLDSNTSRSIDRPIWLGRGEARLRHDRGEAAPLRLRLVAVKKPKAEAVKAVAEARAQARSKQRKLQPGTLIAAQWVLLVTSLAPADYATAKVLELYRLRWRIEIAFKRMKSLAGLEGPPGECPEVAKAWVLCHLIAVLLTEAQLAAFGDSPRRAPAHDRTCGAHSAC